MKTDNSQKLFEGIYLLRCGYADFAFRQLREVDLSKLKPEDRFRWIIESHRALRLGGRLEDAKNFALQIAPLLTTLSQNEKQQWQWELKNLEVQCSGKVDGLLKAATEAHYQEGSYVLESKLLAFITKNTSDFSLDSVRNKINELSCVYHELLVRAALALEGKVFEYQFLSLKLSAGRTHDVLNLLSHLPKCAELQEEIEYFGVA